MRDMYEGCVRDTYYDFVMKGCRPWVGVERGEGTVGWGAAGG